MTKVLLDELDIIQESSLDAFFDVFYAIDDYYSKHNMIQENYSDEDFDKFDYVVQEGAISDEMKKMKGENESKAFSILASLPRFIAAIIKVITSKTDSKKAVEFDSEKIGKSVNQIVKSKDPQSLLDSKKGHILKVTRGVVVGLSLVAAGTGIVLHVKGDKSKSNSDNKADEEFTVDVEVDKKGNVKGPDYEKQARKADKKFKEAKAELAIAEATIKKLEQDLKTNKTNAADVAKLNQQLQIVENKLKAANAELSSKTTELTNVKYKRDAYESQLGTLKAFADDLNAISKDSNIDDAVAKKLLESIGQEVKKGAENYKHKNDLTQGVLDAIDSLPAFLIRPAEGATIEPESEDDKSTETKA